MHSRIGVCFALLALAVPLCGCKVAAALNPHCKKIKDFELHVARDQTCTFPFNGNDYAKYVVVVIRPPMHGEAKGEGKFLKYVAKPGYVGEDQLTIRIERQFAHVQWEVRKLTVKVGENILPRS